MGWRRPGLGLPQGGAGVGGGLPPIASKLAPTLLRPPPDREQARSHRCEYCVLSDPDEHRQRAIDLQHRRIVQSADYRADALACHCHDLVDLNLRNALQAIGR